MMIDIPKEIAPSFTVHILAQTKKAISKMPLSLQEKLYFDLDDLAVYGNELQEPKVRDLGDSLKELRTSAKDGIARSFFFFLYWQADLCHSRHTKEDSENAKTRFGFSQRKNATN